MVLHLLPGEKLAGYGAHVVLAEVVEKSSRSIKSSSVHVDKIEGGAYESKLIPTGVSKCPIGIGISGWNITSKSKSPIASEAEVEILEAELQELAVQQDNSIDDNNQCSRRKILLHPPEIVFVQAFLKLEYLVTSEGESKAFELKFLPDEALHAWASIHRYLPIHPDGSIDDKKENQMISILKSADAETWIQKKDGSLSMRCAKEFQFDWTFSTPYTGSLDKQSSWFEEQKSGIDENMHMLVDELQPILMFDDLRLYEDDLHDNGEALLTVKIRVMPKCFYILMRFFLRVDNVIVRCRDVRFFHKFGDGKVFREIVWREIPWRDLSKFNLPIENTKWRIESCQHLLGKLPTVGLPSMLYQYSSSSIKR